MTDNGSSLHHLGAGSSSCVKTFETFGKNEEKIFSPKIIIKKRPPRRPKLKDGADSGSTLQSNNTLEAAENRLQSCNTGVNLEQNQLESISRIHQTDEIIRATERQFRLLQISQENNDFEEPQDHLSIQKKLSNKRNRRNRKGKKKQIQKSFDHQNIEVHNVEAPIASTSTDVNIKEPRGLKDKNKSIYFVNTKYWNQLEILPNASSNEKHQENSEKHNRVVKNHKAKKGNRKKVKKKFCEHLAIDVIKIILADQDPKAPNVIEGNLRINPRCCQNAYIPLPHNDENILIIGLKDRNRALEGDRVAVIINSSDKWFRLNENTYRKTGYVISILEKTHPRKAVGFLKQQDVFVFLQPRDIRVPLMKINPTTVPNNFYDDPELFKDILFLGKIVDWKKVAFAEGEIEQVLGNKGDLSVESNAILLENNLILEPFQKELLQDLPTNYLPSVTDIADRIDLRKTCIFTIDPATAVDIDDGLSCKILENGNIEVGVHIADVTHFLQPFSPLDEKVAERATTVYMVDKVYHMLPKELCLACSLLPGQDKLAFSVILEMTPSSDVVQYSFCKTVINSCCQMSYDQAQIMIDDKFYNWDNDDTLKITGSYKSLDLVEAVNNLYKISMQLRNKRFEQGALKIDQPKLCVFLDKETRVPISYKLEEKKESNSLIEEFMLLANMTVAKHLYENGPEVSLLRMHAEPSQRMLLQARNVLGNFGVSLNIESAGSLYNSLIRYQKNYDVQTKSKENCSLENKMLVINNLCAKSMKRAQYVCSSSVKTKDELKHYALNVELYTHFTSPIRRYPDCIVHRLLYASIKNEPIPPEFSKALCQKMAVNCNVKKYAAKIAQEQSNTLYFTYMLDLRGSMNVDAVVSDVKERSADAILCDTGLKIRLYFADTMEETTSEFTTNNEISTVKIIWIEKKIIQVINVFSILHIKITKHPQLFKLQGIILPPT